jgi:hypothetical protein
MSESRQSVNGADKARLEQVAENEKDNQNRAIQASGAVRFPYKFTRIESGEDRILEMKLT